MRICAYFPYIRFIGLLCIMIIKSIIKEFSDENILVLGRYGSQIRFLNRTFGKKIKILDKVIDGKMLLSNVDVFVGSCGTMTAESALLGIPTISYNAVPNLIESYLVKNKLVKITLVFFYLF